MAERVRGMTAAAAWNPGRLTGLLAYGRADTAGNTVSQWNDETGNGNHLTQPTVGYRNAIRTNGFNGRTSYVPPDVNNQQAGWQLPAGFAVDRRNFTFFCVVRPRSVQYGGDRAFLNMGALTELLIDQGDNTGLLRVFDSGTNKATTVRHYANPFPLIVRGSASGTKLWLGNQTSNLTAFAAGTSTGGVVFKRLDPGFTIGGDQYEWGFLAGQISDEDADRFVSYSTSRYCPVTFGKQIVLVGTSLDEGANATNSMGYANLMSESLGGSWQLRNYATSGITLAQQSTITATLAGLYDAGKSKNVAICNHGTNDLGVGGDNAATLLGRINTWATAMKTAGWYTVVGTILPRADSGWDATKESNRVSVNTSIRSGAVTNADAVCDWELDSQLTDPNNLTYFAADKLHLTDAAQPIMRARIQSIVGSA